MSNRPGRNDPCPCGSGKKYKHCCALKEDRLPLGTRIWFVLIGRHAADRSLAGPHDDQLELITESPTASAGLFCYALLSFSGATALKARSPVWGFLFDPAPSPARSSAEWEDAVEWAVGPIFCWWREPGAALDWDAQDYGPGGRQRALDRAARAGLGGDGVRASRYRRASRAARPAAVVHRPRRAA